MAGYIAKYSTKAAEAAGAIDHRIARLSDLDGLDITPHARQMIATCLDLARLPDYRETSLINWAHMLGYRGHCTTKSATYSTTLTKLRGERAEHRAAQRREALGLPEVDPSAVVVDGDWKFIGIGLRHGEAQAASGIRDRYRVVDDLGSS